MHHQRQLNTSPRRHALFSSRSIDQVKGSQLAASWDLATRRMPPTVPAACTANKKRAAAATAPGAKKKSKKRRCTPITTVPNFGGRRCGADGPTSVKSWAAWDCDPYDKSGRAPTQKHGYGRTFPWHFDMMEKAYVLEGSATLTPDDVALHGAPITISAKDMVSFPKGWRGTWEVHSFLRKKYAFFDGSGIRVDESDDEEEEEE